jgi:hypothetical protein
MWNSLIITAEKRMSQSNSTQVISSGWTLAYKSLVPLLLVAANGLLLLTLLYNPPKTLVDGMIPLVMLVAPTVLFCWQGVLLKQVRIDQDNLYVAGFFKELTIPFTAVQSVDDFHGWPVILRLKEKSDFGRTILFLGKWYPLLPWQSHPIVGQLTQLIKQKKIG